MTAKSKKKSKTPLVAIIGRPNVGKSTLFNRLIGQRKAIVHEISGITRDRIEGVVKWDGYEFTIADLAGWQDKLDSPFEIEVKEIIDETFERANLILFMVDGRSGIIPQDKILANKIRRYNKPVILVVNKIDSPEKENLEYECTSLGFEHMINISAAHSRRINDLLDEIISLLEFPEEKPQEEKDESISIAIVGRQNVGKSSLFNCLLGNRRSIVSPIPGTTRDSVDSFFEYKENRYSIVDTAGLRKQSKVKESIEYYSTVRAQGSLQRAEIALFLVDAGEGITDTDKKVGGMIQELQRAVIIVANKWDLTKDTQQHRNEFIKHAYKALHFFSFAPVVFTSAIKAWGIEELMTAVEKVHFNYNLRIQTSELNRIIHDAHEDHPPQSYKGRFGKFFYAHQVETAPPIFQFFVNDPKLFHRNYRRYLEKEIRNVFGFDGAPLAIYYKKRGKSKGSGKDA